MTNRNNDIRRIINLFESANITEGSVDLLSEFTDKVIEAIKSEMDKDPEGALSFIDNSSDFIYDLISKEPDEFMDKVIELGWPENPRKEFAYLNKKFKEKYNMSFSGYADKLYDDFEKADIASIKPNDKKIYKLLSDKLTSTASPKWAAANLLYYVSGKKVIVEDTGNSFPSAVFSDPSFNYLGVTKEQFIDWLESHGIKSKKRPKRHKPTPSLYD